MMVMSLGTLKESGFVQKMGYDSRACLGDYLAYPPGSQMEGLTAVMTDSHSVLEMEMSLDYQTVTWSD